MYLLDSDVVVALRHPTPHRAVLNWVADMPANRLHISVISIGEIQAGIEDTRAKDRLKAQELEEWLLRPRCACGVLATDPDDSVRSPLGHAPQGHVGRTRDTEDEEGVEDAPE